MSGDLPRNENINYSPFDELAGEYDAWFDKDGKNIFYIEAQAFRTLLPALPRPWLEIGVGSGRFAQALGIENGIDPSIEFARMAKKRGIKTVIGSGEQRLFDEISIGTVFLIVTLCFLNNPLEVLKEAHRILIPGGKIVIGFVPKNSPWGRFYLQKKKQGHRFYKYATFYGHLEVSKLLKQAGFVPERAVTTLFQKPGEVRHIENAKEGFSPEAGFAIISAGKKEEGGQ